MAHGTRDGGSVGRRQSTAAGLDLTRLNAPQREAVLHGTGPLLVLAGAGSGKTQVIINRIARLICDGVPAERVLGVTFTNKAAREMRERLVGLVGRRASEVWLSTFHSLGLAVLREEHEAAGLASRFTIYDTSDQLGLVRELMRRIKVADRRLDAAKVLQAILEAKRQRRAEVELRWGDDYELAAYDLYPRYIEQMKAFNAVDFDDLILRAQDVLALDEVRQRWSDRFEYLLVDEYQDTSPDQLELIGVLAGERRNICAVGDDDQSIYAWRGAAVDNILSFSKHFPGTHEVVLDQNYRSTGHILAAANAVICNNSHRKPKSLWSASGEGPPVEIVTCADGDDEATFASETIGRLLYDGVAPGDVAVLYRSNAQSRVLEETLAMERIPFRVVGGQAFFDRKEVRDALAFLAVAANPRDELSLRRIINVPPRGIGATSVQRLAAHGEQTGRGLWGALREAHTVPGLPKSAVAGAQALAGVLQPSAKRLREASGGQLAPLATQLFADLRLKDSILSADDAPTVMQRRMQNLEGVVGSLQRFAGRLTGRGQDRGAPLQEFLRSTALTQDPSEDHAPPTDQVTLMTLHSAKGLEFQYVLMVGVEEDLLPHKRTLELAGDLAEERRLCYVGITRARKRLWLTHASRRKRHGTEVRCSPSRFLDEIPETDGVRRWRRDEPRDDEQSDQLAADFFRKMRDQLGMD